MIDTVFNLIAILMWVGSIITFIAGLFLCFSTIISGEGWDQVMAIIGLVLGVLVFALVYKWMESILWCLLASGVVLCKFSSKESGRGNPEPTGGSNGGYTLGDAVNDMAKDYIEQKKLEDTIVNAMNRHDRGY